MISENNHIQINEFVLQPQNNELKLKMWLNKNNYEIVNDFIVKDRHIYYNVIKIKLGKPKKQSLFNLKFGKENLCEICQKGSEIGFCLVGCGLRMPSVYTILSDIC